MKKLTLSVLLLTIITVSLFTALIQMHAETEERQYGGTLRVGINQNHVLHFWSPYQGGGSHWKIQYYSNMLYEKLLKRDVNWNWVPELATKYWSPDGGKTWIFELNQNVKWHDGVPFTSEDVKFHFEVVANWTYPETKIGLIFDEGVKTDTYVEKITTPDDYTVVFHLYNATAFEDWYGGHYFYGMCLPKHLFEGVDISQNDYPSILHPIATGPFKFVKHVEDAYIEYERNEDYWGDRPYLDGIICYIFPTPEAAVIALEAGKLDYIHDAIYVPPVEINRLNDSPDFDGIGFPTCNIFKLGFNLHPDHLALIPEIGDAKLRRALSYAIDRESIVEHVFLGMTDVNSAIYATRQPNLLAPDLEHHAFDPEKAKKMLDDAGYTVKADGWRVDLGEMVSYEILVDAAEVIASNWADVGVKIKLRSMEYVSIVDKLEQGEKGIQTIPGISILLCNMQTLAPGYQTYRQYHSTMTPPSGTNFLNYKSPEMDLLIDTLLETIDVDERQKIHWEISKVYDRDMPSITLADKYRTVVWSTKLGGVLDAVLPNSYWAREKHIGFLGTTPEPTPPDDDLEQMVKTNENSIKSLSSDISDMSLIIDSQSSQLDSLESQLDALGEPAQASNTMSYIAIAIAIVAIGVAYYFGTQSKK